MMPYVQMIGLYFFGLSFIVIAYLLGLFFTRKFDKSMFESFFLGYLILISSYAIVKTSFYSISIFIPFWLLIYIYGFEHQSLQLHWWRNLKINVVVLFSLWTSIFFMKATMFWNFNYHMPNMLFADYPYYMKLAEGFSLTGHENSFGHKNVIFPELNFMQAYRTNDLWLPSFGLDFNTSDTYFIWELFYTPVVYFMASLSIFSLSRYFKKNILQSIIYSLLSLFAFSGFWYRYLIDFPFKINSGSWDPIGIFSYPKLALVYAVFFATILVVLKKKYFLASFQLLVLIFLIQSTIAIIPVLIIFLLLSSIGFFRSKDVLRFSPSVFMVCVLCFIGLFILVYKLNLDIERSLFSITNDDILNNKNILELITSFIKKIYLMTVSYYWLSLLLVFLFSYILIKNNNIRWRLLSSLILFYLVSVAVYTYFKNIGDAYQFSTNIFGPLLISLLITFFLSFNSERKKINATVKSIFIIICCVGFLNTITFHNSVYSPYRIKNYSKSFLDTVKLRLQKSKHTYGIRFYGPDEGIPHREDFPLHEAGFLKLFGRNYDVFNINAAKWNDSISDNSLQKYKLYNGRNALNIYRGRFSKNPEPSDSVVQLAFIEEFQIGYCISFSGIKDLPFWLQKRVKNITQDSISSLYYYGLN